jgi:hypothetical protein
MKFRNSEVRFVDVLDPALNIPAPTESTYVESRMNSSDDFAENSDFQ